MRSAATSDSPSSEERQRALDTLEILRREYPDARTLLHHKNAFQLLVATVLSAQCTDARVNMVTPALFERYPDPKMLAQSDQADLEGLIRTTGFYRNKARALRALSQRLVEVYRGEVPRAMDDLVTLAGVGRKTANVMIGACFGGPAVIVDTHFGRVTRRLGLTRSTDPTRVENDIRSLVPEAQQTRFSMVVNLHGRRTCRSRKPDCESCPIRALCPYPEDSRALSLG